MEKYETQIIENNFDIQRRVSLTIIIMGTIATAFNIYYGFSNGLTPHMIRTHPSIISVISIILVMIITFNMNSNWVKLLQLLCLFGMGILSMLDNYKTFYGMGMYILAIVLMHRYRFFRNWLRIKILTLLISVISVVEISATINEDINKGSSIYAIIYILFFLLMLYLLYADELNKVLFHNRKIEKSMNDIIIERNQYKEQLEDLQSKITQLESSVETELFENNLKKYNFTLKELEVIELLCTQKLSNKELATKLFVSEGTIKQHLNKIYNKCGVRKRIDLIDLFRHNFK